MKFDKEVVETYLKIINDNNPIHSEIVPGQLVCEWLLNEVSWRKYTVQYKKPIYINEFLKKEITKDKIYCTNEHGIVKIEVKKEKVETN
ncbi:hypothetical protein JTF04_04245 [Mammaliicoccus vitulinus]|uniref:hypothetical protein n=2 Tax=Mammaliicoccus vitulinus TaxID=71237 RepID=UPI0002ECD9A3|nr:hypothetical protein [Mammaliicoccus vitulinus]MBM6628884.1 hypothetical protein [Mammaliicoccus vitulinus]MBO3076579.1 hypothetical protein [Mammaliicoccus vitulinus]